VYQGQKHAPLDRTPQHQKPCRLVVQAGKEHEILVRKRVENTRFRLKHPPVSQYSMRRTRHVRGKPCPGPPKCIRDVVVGIFVGATNWEGVDVQCRGIACNRERERAAQDRKALTLLGRLDFIDVHQVIPGEIALVGGDQSAVVAAAVNNLRDQDLRCRAM
ncbi:unnamed protein product, partial [Ectocarpus sp. 13 AM-2016]